MSEKDLEKRNNRIGWITSVGIHAAVFLLLFFMVAWRAPNPPLPEYGIELNFGLDDQGSGDLQPQTPVGNNAEGEEKPVETSAQQTQESKEQPAEQASEENTNETAVEEQAVSKVESPVKLKEQKKEQKEQKVVKEDTKAVPAKETVNDNKTDNKKDVAAVAKGEPGNQGDDKKAVGDKGSEQGKIDAKALYGTPGGGGGGNGIDLQMAGWAWAEQPQIPDLPDNENGRVVFEIECDENGDITGITTIERSLSPKAEQLLKDEIRRNSLQKLSAGRAPERSKGKIIFVLKTR